MNILFTTETIYKSPHGYYKDGKLYRTNEKLNGSYLVVLFEEDTEPRELYEQEIEAVKFAVRFFMNKMGRYPNPNEDPLTYSGNCRNFDGSYPTVTNAYLEAIHWTQTSQNAIEPPPIDTWPLEDITPPTQPQTPQNDPLFLIKSITIEYQDGKIIKYKP